MKQRGKPPARIIIALAIIVLVGLVTVLGAFTVLQLPEPVTEQASKTFTLYQAVLVISLTIYFGVTAAIIWVMARYKRQVEDEELPVQIHGSNVLEASWTIIPILILIGLFIPSVILVIDLKDPPSDAETDVRVEAIGHQWWWEFRYPDDEIVIQATPPNYDDLDPPTLVLPVGASVVIDLSSTDVVHSFSAPNTLYKLQAIPGLVNKMHLTFEETGVFSGQCYQFCGVRHADMRFLIDVREQADYEAWLSETQAAQGIDPAKLAASED